LFSTENKFIMKTTGMYWLLLGVLSASIPSYAQPQVTLFIQIPMVAVTDTFVTARLRVVDFQRVGSLEFSLAFPADTLELTDTLFYLNGMGASLPGSGKIGFSWVDFSTKGVTLPDSAIIATLIFKVKKCPDGLALRLGDWIRNKEIVLVTGPSSFVQATLLTLNNTPGPLFFSVFPKDTLHACVGQPIALTATCPGCIYRWDDGDTSGRRIVSKDGIYRIEINSANCSWSGAVQVLFAALPQPRLPDQDTCRGSILHLMASVDCADCQYEWSTKETTNSIAPIAFSNTLFAVTVTIREGCIASDTARIRVSNLLFTLHSKDPDCGSTTGGTAWVVATSGISPFQYQ